MNRPVAPRPDRRHLRSGQPATPEDVLLHKLCWNRSTPPERQHLDALGVFAVQSSDLDMEYVHHWAKKLNVSAELDDLITGRLRPKST